MNPMIRGNNTLHEVQSYITPPVVSPKRNPVELVVKSALPNQSNRANLLNTPPGTPAWCRNFQMNTIPTLMMGTLM